MHGQNNHVVKLKLAFFDLLLLRFLDFLSRPNRFVQHFHSTFVTGHVQRSFAIRGTLMGGHSCSNQGTHSLGMSLFAAPASTVDGRKTISMPVGRVETVRYKHVHKVMTSLKANPMERCVACVFIPQWLVN